MKVLDVTEFYSQRGGGVRSHLTLKSHVLCQLGHDHVVVAPGPLDEETTIASCPTSANDTEPCDRGPDGSAPLRRPTTRGKSTSIPEAKVIRVGGRALPYDPTYHLLWRIDKIRGICERERPDVLEINSPYVAAASALSVPRTSFGIRTFMWHADFIDTYLRVMLERRLPSRAADVVLEPLWAMVRTIARGCDATFVAAKWQVEKLAAHGVPRVVHLPFGVEKSVFFAAARDAETRRALLGNAPANTALLVGVGRFAWEKRWDVVLDAFVMLRKTREARLVLFGDGPERAAMEARVSGRADVTFAGFERDRATLARALASADVLVHGCPFETFGLGVAEALSCGLPVVVPDDGGAAELADGGGGTRYRTGDVAACALAIGAVLGDLEAMREGACRASARVPTVNEQFARTCDAYRELLAKAKPR